MAVSQTFSDPDWEFRIGPVFIYIPAIIHYSPDPSDCAIVKKDQVRTRLAFRSPIFPRSFLDTVLILVEL